MMKRVPFVLVMAALLLSACAQATPTTDPAQIQASAVAAANTMVAMTQAAVPTETPVPPTPLPSPTALPSPTLQVLPTLALTGVPTQKPQTGGGGGGGGGGNGDPCQAPLPAKPAGPLVSVHISNTTKGGVVFSMWLTQKTPFGECGYAGAAIGSGGAITLTVPEGCYGAGAFVDAPKQHKAFGNGCFKSQANGTVTVDSTDIIKFGQ